MDYFIEREKQHIEEMLAKDRVTKREIQRIIAQAQADITQQINDLRKSLAGRENISVDELLKQADKMDVELFSEKAKVYVQTKDFSPQANRELRLYNYKMKVSRLELIKAQLNLELTAMMNDVDKLVASDLYNDAMSEFRRQAGILGETTPKRLKTQITAIINGSYLDEEGKDGFVKFSSKLWGFKRVLQSELERLVTRATLAGQHPRVTAREIKRVFNVTTSQAVRLARTESTRIQTEVQHRMFEKAGAKRYMIIGEPDACSKCTPYLGKVFRIDEWIYTPPFHPHCRCSVIALPDDYYPS
ncbi:Phage Mu protein F like protein [Enterococcus faecium]|nr:Phage Mu protein F like protein [Enterococcus faecium]